MGCIMAARIVHFGTDECWRLEVLSGAGYIVEPSGTSIPRLSQLLTSAQVDAIAISEDRRECDDEVVMVSRSLSPAPIILFQGVNRRSVPPPVDLVISSTSHSISEWLQEIESLIQRSKRACEQSKTAREEAVELREQAQALRAQSAATRQSAAQQLLRTEAASRKGHIRDKKD